MKGFLMQMAKSLHLINGQLLQFTNKFSMQGVFKYKAKNLGVFCIFAKLWKNSKSWRSLFQETLRVNKFQMISITKSWYGKFVKNVIKRTRKLPSKILHHKFIMQSIIKIMSVCSFISLYILHMNILYWKHVWHINKYVNRSSTNL